MKKITLLIVLLAATVGLNAQVLNQNAAWPNAAWTVSGSYATAVAAFESDPRVSASFAFDDDDAGSGHEDNIAAESPVIDLTAAHGAGETWLFVTADYGYRYFDFDVLRVEYWNADAAAWVAWGANIPGNSTTATDDYCNTITKTNYLSSSLNIGSFTPTQLSGFKYRIFYDDTIGGTDWNYGFCFNSPTIYSQTPPSCPAPITLGASPVIYNSADLFWTETGSATTWNVEYGVTGFTQGTGTLVSGATNPQSVSLTPSTTYQFYVQSSCGGAGTSTWSGPFSFSTPATPPVNDDCSGAIALTVNPDYACGTVTAGTVLGATASAVDAAACFGTEDDDVWFSFVATATSHRIVLSNIAGSVTDMYHSLWTGADCNSLSLVAGSCSDPNTSNPTGLTIGQTYYVRVYTYTATGGQTSTFNICIGSPPPPPANDDCSGAIALTVNPDYACGVVTAGTITSATASAVDATACGGTEDDDVWFSFVATATTHRIVLSNVVGSVTDMYHSLWTGADCNSLSLVAGSCSDPNTSNPTGLTIGQTYYVRVYTLTATGGQSTTFNICIGTTPPPPANDECSGAIALTVNSDLACAAVTAGTITSATASAVDATACGGTEDDDVWFSFVATATSHRIVLSNVVGSVTDMYHSLWTGADCNSLSLVAGSCSDPNTSNPTGLTIGQTYYVRVYTFTATGGQSTTFNICIGTPPPPPANDTCSGAIALTAGGVFADYDMVGTTANATTVTGLTYACQTSRSNDVWYSVVVPPSGSITVETQADGASALTDTVLSVFSGTCGGTLTEIACSDDEGTGNFSIVNITGQTPGSTLYIGVWKWSSATDGTFLVSAYDASLSSDSFDATSFKAYPNPVKDVLNLSYTTEISSVEVFNMLGQKVMVRELNVAQGQIDMSNLTSGNYMVKVTADGQTKTIKVVKQ